MARGTLEWLITIPADGSLPLGGVAPALIQWHARVHPASAMPDLGCSLEALDLLHPEPARIAALLRSLELAEPAVPISVLASAAAGLVAHIRTPHGVRTIGTGSAGATLPA